MAAVIPPTPKQQFVSLLQAILRDVKDLDEVSFERFLAGNLKISVVPKTQSRSSRTTATCSDEQIEQLKASLEKATAREEAKELIGSVLHTKRDMRYFARCLDIPVPSKASSEEVMSRLVEGTVGYRLRSAAIRKRGPSLHMGTARPAAHDR